MSNLVIIKSKNCKAMINVEKKKRTTHSGSRSKSKKCKGHQFSVDLRAKQTASVPPELHKIKTENSSSLNKSKPSRKTSTKPQKKHSKSNNRDHKDPPSHSVSADRRHSYVKINRTEANFQGEDLDYAVDQLLMGLRVLPQPLCLNAKLISQYFTDIQNYYYNLERPLQKLCLELHFLYMNPINKILDLIAPMEVAIRRKQSIAQQIDKQIAQNEQLYEKLQPIDIEIFKLKEKIEQNRMVIEHKRQGKQQNLQRSRQKQRMPTQNQTGKEAKEAKGQGIGRGFRLDLESIHNTGNLGYHDEFYSKIDEFSKSWRDQAMKQKRF